MVAFRSVPLLFLQLWVIATPCFYVTAFLPSNNAVGYKRKSSPSPVRPSSREFQQYSFSHLHKNKMLPLQAAPSVLAAPQNSMFLVRIVFLRALAFVYGVAFMVAFRQNKALIGDNGITPARRVLDNAQARGQAKRRSREEWIEKYCRKKTKNPIRALGNRINRFEWYKNLREVLWDRSDRLDRPVTTLLWLAPNRDKLNPWLDRIALSGFALASIVAILGAANVPLLLALWCCQRSLMAVGGPWYGYGWEPQLAELGFHALFLVPLLSLDPLAATKVPGVVVWAMRWYLFRIMMGAGLIKLKPSADPKWKDLTAMDNFYETQPVPNPLTRYFHWMPPTWHKFEVLSNHFVEVVAPWLLILPGLPRSWRRTGGMIQLVFQSVLISSGNLR